MMNLVFFLDNFDAMMIFFFTVYPTNNALLINFRLSSDAETLLTSTD